MASVSRKSILKEEHDTGREQDARLMSRPHCIIRASGRYSANKLRKDILMCVVEDSI